MTAHAHPKYVDGCYRCELSRDEMGFTPLPQHPTYFVPSAALITEALDLAGIDRRFEPERWNQIAQAVYKHLAGHLAVQILDDEATS